jgi:hypothetical protein
MLQNKDACAPIQMKKETFEHEEDAKIRLAIISSEAVS